MGVQPDSLRRYLTPDPDEILAVTEASCASARRVT